jgi:molybdenum cofactor guanylyltransferase
MEVPKLSGLVLSGGKSSRMGIDKSTLDYHGQPQLYYMVGLLSNFCDNVFVSTRKDQPVREGLNYLPDRFEIAGPMNGILSALSMYPQNAWLIVAVDMPNVGADAMRFLIGQRDPTKLATCFLNDNENLPEPLLTIWEPAARLPLTQFVETRNISPREFLHKNDIRLLRTDDPSILLNINSPDEYKRFKSNLSKG